MRDVIHVRWSIIHSLTSEAMLTLIQAFVSSRLDDCNSVLAGVGLSSRLLQKMHAIQNAAARFVMGARRGDHMTSVLRELHWLPVRQRIRFETAVMVYKCIHNRVLPPKTGNLQNNFLIRQLYKDSY